MYPIFMRTTIDINDTLLHAAEAQATATNRTLAAVVATPLPTSGSGGLLPGVDLTNSAALLDVMEEVD